MPVTTSPEVSTVPDLALDQVQTRDVELALLGLLPAGHLLGGTVGARGTAAGRPEGAPWSGSPFPPSWRTPSRGPGAPSSGTRSSRRWVAWSTSSTPARERVRGPSCCAVTSSRNGRVRAATRAGSPSPADLLPHQEQRTLVLVERPPVRADEGRLRAVTGAGTDAVYVVVADSPRGDVPFTVLMSTARAWVAAEGLEGRVQLRSAPMAWRDEVSDRHLADLLARGVGASTFLRLAAGDGSDGAEQWRDTWSALERGQGDPLPGVSAPVAHLLTQWRPPRRERGLVVMFSGLSGSGKSTLARDVAEWVRASHRPDGHACWTATWSARCCPPAWASTGPPAS